VSYSLAFPYHIYIKVLRQTSGLAVGVPLGAPKRPFRLLLVLERVPTMFTILICLAHTFLPDAATLVAQVEMFATVMSVAVFGFIAYQSLRNSRPNRQPRNGVCSSSNSSVAWRY